MKHKVKFSLANYHCGNCETGVVQVIHQVKRGLIETKVSGCLDCGKEYGILQATNLETYKREDMVWA